MFFEMKSRLRVLQSRLLGVPVFLLLLNHSWGLWCLFIEIRRDFKQKQTPEPPCAISGETKGGTPRRDLKRKQTGHPGGISIKNTGTPQARYAKNTHTHTHTHTLAPPGVISKYVILETKISDFKKQHRGHFDNRKSLTHLLRLIPNEIFQAAHG